MSIYIDGLIEQNLVVPLPTPLYNWIDIRTKILLDERIQSIFSACCFGVQQKIIDDNIANSNFRVSIIFDAHFDVHITGTDGIFLGTQFSMIIYPVQDWLEGNYSDRVIALSIIEEMCHYFWNVSDEWEIQKYVVKVYKRAFPTCKAIYPYKDHNTLQLLPEMLPPN